MTIQLNIEVAYASADMQKVISLTMPEGSLVEDAIHESGILRHFPEIDLNENRIGIYSQPCTLGTRLRERDRVEIYRPLLADPKEIRRKRAAEGKIMRSRRKFD